MISRLKVVSQSRSRRRAGDALTTRRVYKDAMRHDQAITIIIEGRSTHFDPNIVDAFAEITDEFKDIAGRYSD